MWIHLLVYNIKFFDGGIIPNAPGGEPPQRIDYRKIPPRDNLPGEAPVNTKSPEKSLPFPFNNLGNLLPGIGRPVISVSVFVRRQALHEPDFLHGMNSPAHCGPVDTNHLRKFRCGGWTEKALNHFPSYAPPCNKTHEIIH